MAPRCDPEGWYPDPYRQDIERWWTGASWGPDTRPRSGNLAVTVHQPAPPGVPEPAPPGDPATAGGRDRFWPVVGVLAGAGMATGSFLPWATISGTFGQHASMRGTSAGDGWVSFAFGIVICLAGAVSVPRPHRLATVVIDVGALAASVLTIYEFIHVTTGSGVLSASNGVGIYDVGVGGGLVLVAVAAVVSLISAAAITGRDGRSAMAR